MKNTLYKLCVFTQTMCFKPYLLSCAFGALFVANLSAQNATAQDSLFATMPRTTVTWNRDTLFFGELEEGNYLLDSFVVRNTGVNPYHIKDVRTTCDCAIVKYPKEPLQPGGTAAVRFEFDSRRKAGYTQPALIVYDNSSPNLRKILYLDGTVVPRKNVKILRN